MFPHEVRNPSGPGRQPDVLLTGGQPASDYTLPAGQSGDLAWHVVRQKSLIANRAVAEIFVLIDDVGCTDTHIRAIPLASGHDLVIGGDRPHEHSRISLYSTVDLILAGPSKNVTVVGWPRLNV